MNLVACIELTSASEPADAAVASILALPKGTFSALFIQSPGGRSTVSDRVKRLLAELDVRVAETGNMEDDIPDGCQAVLYIPPECTFSAVGLKRLTKAMRVNAAAGKRYTHYSMSSVSLLDSASLWLGFFPIFALLDWCWALPRFKLPQDSHLRLVYVLSLGPYRANFLAERHWFWRLWGFNMGEHRTLDGNGAVTIPRHGFGSLISYVRRHYYLGRFWSLSGNAVLTMTWLSLLTALYSLYRFEVHVFIVGGIWIALSLALYWVASAELSGAAVLPLCTLWPVYAVLSPVLVTVVRFFLRS